MGVCVYCNKQKEDSCGKSAPTCYSREVKMLWLNLLTFLIMIVVANCGVNRVGSIPELAVMFENCSSSSRPSVLKLSHYSSSYLKKLNEEKERVVDGACTESSQCPDDEFCYIPRRKKKGICRKNCSCGKCGHEDPECAWYLGLLCRDKKGNKDPDFAKNHCVNCPEFNKLCGVTCNYC